jgi:hypothetical protein
MKTIVAVAFVTLLSSSVSAQKPVKEPFAYEPIEFGAGEVCAFPIHILGDGKQNAIFFPSGRQMIVGTGAVTVTNVTTGASIAFAQSGRYVETLLPDGTAKLETNGQQLFFALPQDVGGPALTLATGKARMIYDMAADAVTSLRLSGRTIDVCDALSE